MTQIKICGLQSTADAEIMNAFGPDFVGFVFAPSKRQVDRITAAQISSRLNAAILRVGVFVNEKAEVIAQTVSEVDLDVVQLHSDTTPDYLFELKNGLKKASGKQVAIWQRIAVPLGAKNVSEVLSRIRSYPEVAFYDAILFDVITDRSNGGSGVPFPWSIGCEAAEILRQKNPKIIIAGGISAENAQKAVEIFRPFAIDVSGSVETDGKKDAEKVQRLIMTVKKRGST
ncbi:MAG: phosphoribosylanthranilate isomerase [Clostridiaceae bacterium]|nr:phosphoribosylanthranilate isomerase [Clostridiaceae bacterium]